MPFILRKKMINRSLAYPKDFAEVLSHLVLLEVAEHEVVLSLGRVLEELDKLLRRQVRAVLLGELLQELLVLGRKQHDV